MNEEAIKELMRYKHEINIVYAVVEIYCCAENSETFRPGVAAFRNGFVAALNINKQMLLNIGNKVSISIHQAGSVGTRRIAELR